MNLSDVTALADIYRSTLPEGDRVLASNPLEKKILHALVMESASKTAFWLNTRVKGGPAVVEPLNELLKVAVPADQVGKVLAAAQQTAFKEAKATISSLVTTGTTPLWVGAIGSAVVAFFGFAHEIGVMIGGLLFVLLATGGSARYAMMRAIQLAPNAIKGASADVVRTISQARALGTGAEGVFGRTAASAVESVYRSEAGVMAPLTTASTLRSGAIAGVSLAWIVLGVFFIVMLFGAYEGFTAASESTPMPTLSIPIPTFSI